jgi:hypothetical protein
MFARHATTIPDDRFRERPLKPVRIGRVEPLDPPPFYVEGVIRDGSIWSGLTSAAVSVGILATYAALFAGSAGVNPSLWRFILVSIGMGCLYQAVKFLSYWGAWGFTAQKYQVIGTVHPAARGELPRNWLIFVQTAPSLTVGFLCALMYALGGLTGPEVWLVAAVIAGSSLRDLRIALRLVQVNEGTWILQTKNGLDVLQPIDASQVREFQRIPLQMPPSLHIPRESSANHRYL